MRYAVYTMRRTSSRTVYAIYDTELSAPVDDRKTQRPWTTTDRAEATQRVYGLNHPPKAS